MMYTVHSNHKSSSTGILFFARQPEIEAAVKRWTPNSKNNLQLANQLFNHTFSKIKASGLPHVRNTDGTQKGHGFNERLINSLELFFAQGFENAIVLGSDCPNVSLADINKAAQNCKQGISTIGESKDGGVYLFTINKKAFNAKKLANLAWCTNQLANELNQYLTSYSNHSVDQLKKKIDLDNNLKIVIGELNTLSNKLKGLIISLLSIASIFRSQHTLTEFPFHALEADRGPPQMF